MSSISNKKEFDWITYENGLNEYEKEEREKLKENYTKTIPNINEYEIHKGLVTNIENKEIIVDFGFKSEGVISLNEFKDDIIPNVGDTIEVMIYKLDYKGECILSYQKAKMLKNWLNINDSYEKGEIILGLVTARTKGGLIVKIFDIECFLPGSHINIKPTRDYDNYVGKTLEVKVVKLNPQTKNVVVSHKILIEQDLEEQKKEIISTLSKGQIVEGTVKNILPYGCFVDLGGIDALIHITDIKWQRIEHPSEEVKLGQVLNCVVLGIDKEKNRVQLGLKQLQKHPWDILDSNLKVGDIVTGNVTLLADYGAIIEIIPGVEGLIHTSEMSWDSNLLCARDFLKVGDKVKSVILTLDREDRKMYLSIKQMTPDPWNSIEKKYPVGSKHTGIIHSFTNFGVFVELQKDIRGIIKTYDLSWTKKIKHPSEFCKKGDKIDVVVLNLDINARRFSLGHKQLYKNPFDEYENIFTVGSIHKGTVIKNFDKGSAIKIEKNDKSIEAFSPFRYLETKNKSILKKGDQADFKIMEFNKESKTIIVSHTSTFTSTFRNIKKIKKHKSTFGDFTELTNLKKLIESQNK
ncbi:MAG: 30S ribosomal protein S1 [Candidatus Bostrichicola ureolyticus]|nr:MAG: 30S ribosomal protein S1 [Candidatus Bostrichicola ureolyticus]